MCLMPGGNVPIGGNVTISTDDFRRLGPYARFRALGPRRPSVDGAVAHLNTVSKPLVVVIGRGARDAECSGREG